MRLVRSFLLAFACSGSLPAAAATTHVFNGDDAERLFGLLRSAGTPVHPGAENTSDVTTADRLVCGPLNPGAFCQVQFDQSRRTIGKAYGLTALLANAGASEVMIDGRSTYSATNLFCRAYRNHEQPTTCSLDLVVSP